MLYYATSSNLCFCTTWQNGEHKNCIFSLKCCINALSAFNQLLDFKKIFLTPDSFLQHADAAMLALQALY